MVAQFDLINYGSAAGGGQCPPEDTYVLELKDYTQPEEVPSFNDPNKLVKRFRMIFTIVGVPADFSEDERAEWEGFEISTFVNIPKDLNNEKATLGLILKALKPRQEPFGINERIQLPDYIGSKMKAFIKASDSGWPRLSSYAPATRRPSAAPRQAAPPPPAAAGDDGWE